jgi:hypothetical protein
MSRREPAAAQFSAYFRTLIRQSRVIDPNCVWTTARKVKGTPTAAAGNVSLSCQRPFLTGWVGGVSRPTTWPSYT